MNPARPHSLALAVLLVVLCAGPAAAQVKKPRVPIGIDPGGTIIAIAADTGIDYTQKDIASRLARDGEGEVIGWDFVDNDRQPYSALATASVTTDLARLLIAESPASRLAVFRAKPGDKIALGRLAVYAAQSRSRIVILTSSSTTRGDWDAFAEAVTHFKELLVITPLEPTSATFPAALGLANILSVTAPAKAEPPHSPSNVQPDIALASGAPNAYAAAARLAAMAVRLSASEPTLPGAALKRRIIQAVRAGDVSAPVSIQAPSPLALPPAAPR